MQKLMVSVKDNKGPEAVKEVMVLRSWADAAGKAVYLFHQTGIYGYLDGAPVQSEADFDIIDNPIQKTLAKKWWEARGRALSEAYYKAREEEARKLAGDFNEEGQGTDLDYVMYASRPATGGEWSQPFSWMDRFAARPDWWGQARNIGFADVEYRVADQDVGLETPGSGMGDVGIQSRPTVVDAKPATAKTKLTAGAL